MGYYGASAYRGDYYGQGDYYRAHPQGDPGFFDFLGSAVGKVVDVGNQIFGPAGIMTGAKIATGQMSPGQAISGVLGRVLGPGPPIPSPPAFGPTPTWSATSPGTGSTAAMIPTTPQVFTGLQVGGPTGLQIGRRTPMPGGSGVKQFGPSLPHPALMPRTPDHYHHKLHREGVPTHTVFRRVDQWEVKDHRRMNPLNPRALRKAIRRAGAFTKIVGKTLRFTKPGHHAAGFKKFGRKGKR